MLSPFDKTRKADAVDDVARPIFGLWTALAIVAIFGLTIVALRVECQRWWCRCGRLSVWSGDIHGEHNSQHLVDPYSFTHALHGFLFYALLRPFAKRLKAHARLVLALFLEMLWEVAENSDAVIERYRSATIALGYSGDSVLNSLGDIASCGVGYLLATRLPARWSIFLFFLVEAVLLVVYRDGFVLNVLMLLHPIGAVKAWQMGH